MLEPGARKRKYRLLPARSVGPPQASPDPEAVARETYGRSRRELIAELAYFRSRQVQASPVEHWLAAEREIDALLARQGRDVTG